MSTRRIFFERLAPAAVIAVALLIHAPLFLRSPLGPDPVMYDLQTQLVEHGGVLYQDLLEPNLPGAVWIHLAVRSIGGWSPEILRAFDLAWFALAASLAAKLMANDVQLRALLIGLMVTAYSTQSEWCHCQRDVWMLPFVLGAVQLRLSRRVSVSQRWWPPLAEGLLWGAAVWLKPHVVIPAVCVVFACWWATRKPRLSDEAVVILGGTLVGAAGAVWLVKHGAWSPLWTVLTEWNRDYVAASAARWSWGRLWSVQERLAPWSLVHLMAIPASVWALAQTVARPQVANEPDQKPAPLPILAALYLGWLIQTLLLQHLFDYVHLPAIVLGAIVLAMLPRQRLPMEWQPAHFTLAAIVVLASGIAMRADQLAFWPACFSGSSSPELRSALARLPLPEWKQLAAVERFLAQQGIQNGELTAYHTHTIHLYPALEVTPSTRFAFTETHLRLFPARAAEIAAALDRSRQKFVVSDLIEAGLDPKIALDDSDPANWRHSCPQAALSAFPFDQPVVFRAGPYLVHEVTSPVGPVETGFFPLAAKSAGL